MITHYFIVIYFLFYWIIRFLSIFLYYDLLAKDLVEGLREFLSIAWLVFEAHSNSSIELFAL